MIGGLSKWVPGGGVRAVLPDGEVQGSTVTFCSEQAETPV